MELGEYFTKVFGKTFTGQVYWPTFVLTLLLGIITSIIMLIVIASFGSVLLPLMYSSFNTGASTLSTATLTSLIGGLIGSIIGLVIAFVIVSLIISYLMNVIIIFAVKKVQASEKKGSGFFEGLGSSFGTGFKLFICQLIYMIVIYVALIILVMIFTLIPVLGIILNVLLIIAMLLYVLPGILMMTGKIATGSSFGEGLGSAFTTAFKKPKLIGYAFLLYLVLIVILFVGMLLSMIPFLGMIIMLFLMTGLIAYMSAIAYYFSQEK